MPHIHADRITNLERAREPGLGIAIAFALLTLLSAGCLDRNLASLNPCLVSNVVAEVEVSNIDKVDLLFLVDGTPTMKEEQELLRQQIPKLVEVLTTGDKNGDGVADFRPAKDLHLGVVTPDMGLPVIAGVPGCSGTGLGDDGLLQHDASLALAQGASCQPSYPSFLSFVRQPDDPASVHRMKAQQIANDFRCITTLGTDGCGLELQLEATLKALWPSADERLVFLDPLGGITGRGHGDGANNGFLRNDPATGLSLIAIVIVTDQDDGSYSDPSFLDPSAFPDETLEIRQWLHLDKLYDVQERYVKGLKALRPGNEPLIVFAAITGVPADLTAREVQEQVDFGDPAQRDQFYGRILADPRMQRMPNRDGTRLTPACQRSDPADPTKLAAVADPARRLTEVAQGFGKTGLVFSICDEDWSPAIERIIDVIGEILGGVCLPRRLSRDVDGQVNCQVLWELPAAGVNPVAPSGCSDPRYPFLALPDAQSKAVGQSAGTLCRVDQVAVTSPAPSWQPPEGARGWYYDDFSSAVKKNCGDPRDPSAGQRIFFAPGSEPPTGVVVKLECLDEVQKLQVQQAKGSVVQPTIGSPCGDRTPAQPDLDCAITNADASPDTRMFCHPTARVCALRCATDVDCPPSWVCDGRPETSAAAGGPSHCVNPTCGS